MMVAIVRPHYCINESIPLCSDRRELLFLKRALKQLGTSRGSRFVTPGALQQFVGRAQGVISFFDWV